MPMTSSYGLKPLATGSCKAMGQLGVKRDHKLRKRRLVFSALEVGKPSDKINKLNINAAVFLFMVILPVPLLPTSQNQRDVTEESISLEEFQVLRSQMHTGALETSRLPRHRAGLRMPRVGSTGTIAPTSRPAEHLHLDGGTLRLAV
jgi:hypothetical protein